MTDHLQHPDYLALRAAVLASPTDDLPRLVLADWLDEHSCPERADFIRSQCETAGGGRVCTKDGRENDTRVGPPWRRNCRCRPCTLRRRADRVEDKWHRDWLTPYTAPAHQAWWAERSPQGSPDGWVAVTVDLTCRPHLSARWRRGFVWEASCSEAFLRHGLARLMAAELVERIVLWDGPAADEYHLRVEPPDGPGGWWRVTVAGGERGRAELARWRTRQAMVGDLPDLAAGAATDIRRFTNAWGVE